MNNLPRWFSYLLIYSVLGFVSACGQATGREATSDSAVPVIQPPAEIHNTPPFQQSSSTPDRLQLAGCGTASPAAGQDVPLRCAPSPSQAASQTQPGLDLPTKSIVNQSLSLPATPSPTVEFKLCSPLRGHSLEELPQIISDPYRPPPPRHEERHEGVDFSYYRRAGRTSILGVEVQSILAGRVALSLVDKFPYGNFVIVETPYDALPAKLAKQLPLAPGESLYSLYAHMEEPPVVALGEYVDACQLLGKVGKSGNAGVAHLHLETRSGPPGEQFTSMAYYDIHATQEEKDNYLRWRISWDFKHFDPMLLLQISDF